MSEKTAGEMALADLHNRMAKYSAEIERPAAFEQEYIGSAGLEHSKSLQPARAEQPGAFLGGAR